MHNQDQVPTIAELWKEAEFLIELTIPHFEVLANPNNRVNEERRPYYISQLSKCKEKLESLHQQLVERCGSTTLQNGWMAFCFAGKNVGITSTGTLYANHTELTELSAIAGFWAWELEQREKGGNENGTD